MNTVHTFDKSISADRAHMLPCRIRSLYHLYNHHLRALAELILAALSASSGAVDIDFYTHAGFA